MTETAQQRSLRNRRALHATALTNFANMQERYDQAVRIGDCRLDAISFKRLTAAHNYVETTGRLVAAAESAMAS